VKVTDDKQEMVAEIHDGFAVAVIERSQPHFHGTMREIYRVQRGTLYVPAVGTVTSSVRVNRSPSNQA